jgi:hypothetical protein
MPWAPAEALVLSAEQRAELQRLVRAPSTSQKVVMRAKVVLAAAAGRSNSAIASELAISRPTVILWPRRHPPGSAQGAERRAGRPGGRGHAQHQAPRGHALVHPRDGRRAAAQPFEWHTCADEILGKVARCKEALDAEH